ncbi:hypothetical protein BJ944DRAFT_259063 [Cunninghamella echinulata]|nr:hypothetical protein BJ944DRAFT_259063 [Cunninghamella echinulata]
MENSWLSWSSGKDSAYSLYIINKHYKNLEIKKLLCTVNGEYDRVSLHGVRTELLLEQSKQLDIPLYKCILPKVCTMEEYDKIMHSCVKEQEADNNKYIIFGDIHLQDIKNYRMERMKEAKIQCIFPIFDDNIDKYKVRKLGESIIQTGIKAVLVCIDLNKLDKSFIGREYDLGLIDELESLNIDVCGENGEFHTFVYSHPMFKEDIKIKKGDIKINDNLCFIDLILDK